LKKPELTIVATSRNDNHGEDLTLRTNAFLESVYHSAKNSGLRVEVIVVEWNPPENQPNLYDVLLKPDSSSNAVLRVITVPKETHNSFVNSKVIPLYQMIAKNVGIRRADSENILCTNVDILFSAEVFNWLKKNKVQKGKFYRANRCDIPAQVLKIESYNDKMLFAKQNIIKRLGKSMNHEALHLPDIFYVSSKLAALINFCIVKAWKIYKKQNYPYFTLDLEACGDFTLMTKADWLDIDGYAELDMYSIHIDSMALWSCAVKEKKQVILPKSCSVYHIDHKNGWESENPIETIKFLKSKPCLDYSLVEKGGHYLLKNKQNWNINTSDWGFANEVFEEKVFNILDENFN
jgi:hypothetical protein